MSELRSRGAWWVRWVCAIRGHDLATMPDHMVPSDLRGAVASTCVCMRCCEIVCTLRAEQGPYR